MKKYSALQGLRFWAITLVVASHCGVLSQGGVGNDIFFALSGFLAGLPFKSNAEADFLSIKKYASYYSKRFFRIIPVYWVGLWLAAFVLNIFSLTDLTGFESLLLNMFFIKCAGHLWFLQQEVVFYIILPVILTIAAFLKMLFRKIVPGKGSADFLIFIILITASFLLNRYLTAEIFYLNGNSNKLAFRAGDLLCGTAFSYLYKNLTALDTRIFKTGFFFLLSNICVFGFLFMTIFSAEPILSRIDGKYAGYFIGWEMSYVLVFTAAILIVLMLLTDGSAGNRFLGNPVFNYIGNVSYVIYILHFFLLSNFGGNPIQKFIIVYLVSLSLAIIMHAVIEIPAMHWYNNRKEFSFRGYYKNLVEQ